MGVGSSQGWGRIYIRSTCEVVRVGGDYSIRTSCILGMTTSPCTFDTGALLFAVPAMDWIGSGLGGLRLRWPINRVQA